MTLLLILITAGAILYGFVLMKDLDVFLKKARRAEEIQAPEEKTLLLYGSAQTLEPLIFALRTAGISFDMLEKAQPDGQNTYRWVAAFSENDLDNLVLCASAVRTARAQNAMALCNDVTYAPVFQSLPIGFVFVGNIFAQEILSVIGGQKPCSQIKSNSALPRS
jgi:hypothetical protein